LKAVTLEEQDNSIIKKISRAFIFLAGFYLSLFRASARKMGQVGTVLVSLLP